MKLLWLSTSSMGLEPIIKSLEYSLDKLLFTSVSSMNLEPIVTGLQEAAKHKYQFELYKYDHGKEEQHHYEGEVDHSILRKVNDYKPDIIIYSGPAEGKCRPIIDTFLTLKSKAKLINLVCDGGCPNWHPILQQYVLHNAFDLILNVDGNHDWPKRENDLTFPGPIDPRYYSKPKKKTIRFGFAGGCGSSDRQEAVKILKEKCGLVVPERSETWGTYQTYADFMMSCKMVVNFSNTGSGKANHLKYRVIESGLAKVCVLEQANLITKHYFSPGIDYIEYKNLEELIQIANQITDDEIDKKANKLNFAVEKNYTALRTWQTVFDSI